MLLRADQIDQRRPCVRCSHGSIRAGGCSARHDGPLPSNAWSHRRVSCPCGRLRAWTRPSDPSIVVKACCHLARIAWPHEVRASQSPWCQPSTGQGNRVDWFGLFPLGESLFPEDFVQGLVMYRSCRYTPHVRRRRDVP